MKLPRSPSLPILLMALFPPLVLILSILVLTLLLSLFLKSAAFYLTETFCISTDLLTATAAKLLTSKSRA